MALSITINLLLIGGPGAADKSLLYKRQLMGGEVNRG